MPRYEKERDLVLIPPKYLEENSRKLKKLLIVLISIISIIAIFFLIIIPNGIINKLKIEKTMVQKGLNSKYDYYQVGQQYDNIKLQVNERARVAGILNGMGGINLVEILENIEKCLPQNISINTLSVTNSSEKVIQINITGQAATDLEFASFVKALEEDEYFNEVNVTNLNNVTNKSTMEESKNFALGLKINSGM